jgi:DNA-binding response OmpR family regulator
MPPDGRSSGEEKGVAKSILVVEDEPNIVLSLQFLMKKAGFDVRVARDGDEALAAVESHAPDLILLDVMIPKRDGYDVCQTIRANPAWQSIYIIMLTAKGREVDREKGMALGANDYVTKPFSTRDLTEKVKAILENSSD